MKNILILAVLFCGCSYNLYCFNNEDVTNMYSSYVEEWKKEVKASFDDAESKVFTVKPTPDVVGPDPDPAKCICRGTGIIVQGDDHKTLCPYHGPKTQIKR